MGGVKQENKKERMYLGWNGSWPFHSKWKSVHLNMNPINITHRLSELGLKKDLKFLLLAFLFSVFFKNQACAQSNETYVKAFYKSSTSSSLRLQQLDKITWSTLRLSKDSMRSLLTDGIQLAKQLQRMDAEIKLTLLSFELVQELPVKDSSILLNYIQLAKKNKLDSLHIGAQLWLARLYESDNNIQGAEEVLNKLLQNKENKLTSYPKYQSKVYVEKGILFEQKQDYENALKMYSESLRLNEGRKDTFMACSDLLNIARNYLVLNKEAEFKKYNSQALQWAKRSGSGLFEINAYISFANSFGAKGQFDSCIVYAMQAEQLAKKIHSERFEMETNDIIAACYMSLKNPQRAIPYQLRAFELSTLDYIKNPMALNVGLCYIDLGNYSLAEKYYKIALTLSSQLGNGAQANTYNHLGFLAIKQKRMQEALTYFLSAQQKENDVEEKQLEIETKRGLAIAYQLHGESEKSNQLLAEVLPLVTDIKNKVELYTCRAANFIKINQYAEACKEYKAIIKYKDSLADQSDKELTESVLAKYSVDKAEGIARMAVLEKENASLNAAKQKRMKQFGFLLFGLSMALLLLSVYGYVKIKNAKNKIAHQNEQLNRMVEEKEMLMREIHHRVKNNLQVMSGLLQLQSNATSSDDLKNSLAQSQKRITSIAAIHELLYSNHHVQQVDMQAYFEKIIVQTIQIHDEHVQYALDTHQLSLDMDKAIPLGLLLNELVTNSFKHAFVNHDSASISVLLKASDQKTYAYCLQYQDNGKLAFANLSKQQSLGVRIISMMAEQLQGELSFSFENGAKYALYF